MSRVSARPQTRAVAQDRTPADRLFRSRRFCALGAAIHDEPDREPHEPRRTGDDERGAPAVLQGQKDNQRRRDRGADHRACGVNADREAALCGRKMFCDRLGTRGVDAGFTDTQHHPRETELSRVAHPTGRHVGDGPPAEEQCERPLRTELVGDPAGAKIGERVGDQENTGRCAHSRHRRCRDLSAPERPGSTASVGRHS